MPTTKKYIKEQKSKRTKQNQPFDSRIWTNFGPACLKLPSSPDEYLAAGVDFEEGGEKWRAGDPVKVCLFTVDLTSTKAS
ncbi:hypothetical protein Golomagni_03827 [Golovinomyces magnicellulatus]|nr:hypothetical protein Golomagni_03827 [Golovinomyces magnicellulatus]